MKYDSGSQSIKNLLGGAQNILITLPSSSSVDELASGLAFYLALKQTGKNVSIITETPITVGYSNLFAVGDIKSSISDVKGGNLSIILSGVVDPLTQTPPTLKELKWQSQGSDLHLVFYPMPGQRFEPKSISPRYENNNFDLIFVIGAQSLSNLGSVYNTDTSTFSSTNIINIDKSSANTQFGKINIVDSQAASLSEMIGLILPSLGLSLAGDIATNILNGVYSATNNLGGLTTPETYEIIAQALRAGGQKNSSNTVPSTPPIVSNTVSETVVPPSPSGQTSLTQPQQFDFAKIFQSPASVQTTVESQKPISSPTTTISQTQAQNVQPSDEERPAGERVTSNVPELDWLTPKIYKGGNIS